MKLRHAFLLIIGGLLHTSASGQDEIDPLTVRPVAEDPESAPGGVVAAIVLVKSDWSDAEDSATIEAELKVLLEDSSLHESYRNNLLASGVKILFSDEFVSLYEPEQFTALMSWLGKHKLLRPAVIDRKLPLEGERQLLQWNAYRADDDSWTPVQQSGIFVTEQWIPFPPSGRADPPPFTTHSYGWAWTFSSRAQLHSEPEDPLVEVDVVREGQRMELIQTQEKVNVERRTLREPIRFRFDFPATRIPVFSSLVGDSDSMKRFVRSAGWEPITYLSFEGALIESSGEIALAKPASVVKPLISPWNRFEPRAENGRPTAEGQPKPASAEDLSVIKVFTLQWTRATEATNVLTKLLPDCKFAADERSNSIVAHGDEKQLEMVEALLLRLDAEPSHSQQLSTPRIGPGSEAEQQRELEQAIGRMRGKYATTEQKTQSIAEALIAEKDAEATKRLREQLTIVVAEAFGLRQELQRAELALLRERIHRIESQVDQRETLRDAIIQQRVDQLISGGASRDQKLERSGSHTPSSARPTEVQMHFDHAPWGQVFQWFAELNGIALQLNEEPPGTFSYHSPRQQTLEEAREAISAALPAGFELLQNDGQLIARRRVDSPIAVNRLAGVATLRKPDEYRLAIEDLNGQIAQRQLLRARLKQQNNPNVPSTKIYDEPIAKLQERLKVLASEYAAQVRLFELEAEAAKVAVQTTEQSLERAKAMYRGGRVSSSEMGQAILAFKQARVKHDQTTTLLELYRQAGAALRPDPPKDEAPGDSPESDGGANGHTSNKGVTIESLPDGGTVILRGQQGAVQGVLETLKQRKQNTGEVIEESAPIPQSAVTE